MLIKAPGFEPRDLYAFITLEPLLAHYLVRSKIIDDTKLPFVAGVAVKDTTINLYINSEKLSKLTSSERLGVLVHEYLHVILLHCTERTSGQKEKHMKENFAKDMAINQLILRTVNYSLPEFAVGHDKPPFNFPPNLTAEQYYELLDKNYTDEEIEELAVQFSLDDHSQFGDSRVNGPSISNSGKAYVKELAKSYARGARNADDSACLAGAGNEYGNILQKLLTVETHDINWQIQVKRFLAQIVDPKRQFTYKRFSKRYGFPAQGEKFKVKTKVAAIVDTSGSMSDSFLSHIGGQLNLMSKIMGVDVIMCDAIVQGNIKKYKPSRELAFPGRGGTDMQPAFEYALENKYRGVVCFTDGGLYSPVHSKLPTLWVSVNNKQFQPPFGGIAHVEWKESV